MIEQDPVFDLESVDWEIVADSLWERPESISALNDTITASATTHADYEHEETSHSVAATEGRSTAPKNTERGSQLQYEYNYDDELQRRHISFPPNDIRRLYIHKFMAACGAVDAEVLLRFFREFTTEDVMFRVTIIKPIPPFDRANPDIVFRGQVKACEFIFGRCSCVPDAVSMLYSSRTKYFFRSDGSLRIVFATENTGSPVQSSHVIHMLEQNTLQTLPIPPFPQGASEEEICRVTAAAITKRVYDTIASNQNSKSSSTSALSCQHSSALKALSVSVRSEQQDTMNAALQPLKRTSGTTFTLLVNKVHQIYSIHSINQPLIIPSVPEERKL